MWVLFAYNGHNIKQEVFNCWKKATHTHARTHARTKKDIKEDEIRDLKLICRIDFILT